jgi:hypothetical protein
MAALMLPLLVGTIVFARNTETAFGAKAAALCVEDAKECDRERRGDGDNADAKSLEEGKAADEAGDWDLYIQPSLTVRTTVAVESEQVLTAPPTVTDDPRTPPPRHSTLQQPLLNGESKTTGAAADLAMGDSQQLLVSPSKKNLQDNQAVSVSDAAAAAGAGAVQNEDEDVVLILHDVQHDPAI